MVSLFHGTTQDVADAILTEQRFFESDGGGDWLGPGAYFYQDNPEKAYFWAQRYSIEKKKKAGPAVVIELEISLAPIVDLTRSTSLELLRQVAKVQPNRTVTQSSPVLRNSSGKRKKLMSGIDVETDNFFGFNKDDNDLLIDLYSLLRARKKGSFKGFRATFWEGQEIQKGSYFFDHTNTQICLMCDERDDELKKNFVSFSDMPLLTSPRKISGARLAMVRKDAERLRAPI